MSSSDISSGLLMAPLQLNIYLGCFIYVIGFIGSIGNLIIYRSRSLRGRACSIYLFWQSLVNLIYLNSVLLTRILQKGFQIPITTRYDILCRIRQFSSNYGNQLAFTFLGLATLDRILLAQRSIAYRQWGNRITLAKKLVAVSFIIWIVILCHRLIWYGTNNGRCEAQPGLYAYFDNLFDAIVTCLIPIVVITVLGILIEENIRRIVQRKVVPLAGVNESAYVKQSAIRKIDAQLTVMLFMDILVGMISFLPYAAHLVYINITETWPKSALRVAWETIIIETIRLLSYLFFSCPFYVSIISLSGFRQQLLRSIGLKKQRIHLIAPTQQTMPIKLNPVNASTCNHLALPGSYMTAET